MEVTSANSDLTAAGGRVEGADRWEDRHARHGSKASAKGKRAAPPQRHLVSCPLTGGVCGAQLVLQVLHLQVAGSQLLLGSRQLRLRI